MLKRLWRAIAPGLAVLGLVVVYVVVQRIDDWGNAGAQAVHAWMQPAPMYCPAPAPAPRRRLRWL